MTKDLKSILESLIFVAGKPINIKKIAKLVGIKPQEAREKLEHLQEEYQDRGIQILFRDDLVQMVSDPDSALYVKKLLTEEIEENLTRAALETLAIIAYRGPIIRSGIERIRGVNSVYILRNLSS